MAIVNFLKQYSVPEIDWSVFNVTNFNKGIKLFMYFLLFFTISPEGVVALPKKATDLDENPVSHLPDARFLVYIIPIDVCPTGQYSDA